MRYFLEVSYKGTNYCGFQIQQNATTIQSEVEKALKIFFKSEINLTGSSRTDAGVHALQNFFHLDFEEEINTRSLYNLNSILPADIVLKNIIPVHQSAHCRFDAISREYRYYIYSQKNPFLNERAYYFPYRLDIEAMQSAATCILDYSDFTSFSKKNTQVKSMECKIFESKWDIEGEFIIYKIRGNRFLRGMVKALTATMLKIGRHKITIEQFQHILEAKSQKLSSFAVPSQGLFLEKVIFPEKYF